MFFDVYIRILYALLSLSSLNILLILLFTITSRFKKKDTHSEYSPNISIIIPTYNEEKNISHCLDSIYKSNYAQKNLEIICIDDKSTDKTFNILKKYNHYKNFRTIKGMHTGKADALNLGIRASRYEYILTLDADIVLEKSYISQIIKPMRNKRNAYSFGRVQILHPKTFMEYFQAIEYDYMNFVRSVTNPILGIPIWFAGQAVCFRKKSLLAVGLFNNDTLTEDLHISILLAKTYSATVVDSALAYTKPMASLDKLMQQRMRWFFGIVQNMVIHVSLLKSFHRGLLYFYFSNTIWIISSLLFVPYVFSIILIITIFKPQNMLPFFLKSGTVWGIVQTSVQLKLNLFLQNTLDILLTLTTIIMILLIGYAFLSMEKKISMKLLISYFTYFSYILFLRFNVLGSLIKYQWKNNSSISFIK